MFCFPSAHHTLCIVSIASTCRRLACRHRLRAVGAGGVHSLFDEPAGSLPALGLGLGARLLAHDLGVEQVQKGVLGDLARLAAEPKKKYRRRKKKNGAGVVVVV